ncbi:histidine kinase [Paucibacter sp. APW11]|uniref:Histidine kinase n=1 Tax=Roseateles aquae TaxID=3077235 RepID=A0ABU3PF03_9BURK|nr:histidine kinase [Paucibacter sp. APW11]MDT9000688.1 histidine kinase [Paucibacter sp. APW11]
MSAASATSASSTSQPPPAHAATDLLNLRALAWILLLSTVWSLQRSLNCDCAPEPGYWSELREGLAYAGRCALIFSGILLAVAAVEQLLQRLRLGTRGRLALRLAALLLGAFCGHLLNLSLRPWAGSGNDFAWRWVLPSTLLWSVFGGLSYAIYGLQREQTANALRLAQAASEHAALRRGHVEAQIRALNAQIEPHFLFNTLANVKRLYETSPERGQQMLRALNDYLQHALPGMRQRHSTLGEELALVRSYLQIQQLRMGERLQFDIDAAPSLLSLMLPPLLLPTLVENAIKHGLAPLPEGGRINIRARRLNGKLEIEVQDSGRGFGASSGGSGVGLANSRARLQALYGREASLSLLAVHPHGVCARVELPAEEFQP